MNNDFYHQPTAGEHPVVRPTTAPLTHSPYSVPLPPVSLPEPRAHAGVRPLEDNLISPSQKAIIKCCDEIFTILSLGCRCEKCRNGVMVLLSDLLADTLTDLTIINLSMARIQRSLVQIVMNMEQLSEVVKEGRK